MDIAQRNGTYPVPLPEKSLIGVEVSGIIQSAGKNGKKKKKKKEPRLVLTSFVSHSVQAGRRGVWAIAFWWRLRRVCRDGRVPHDAQT